MILITHPTTAVLETPILVIYEVCQPKIIIHTPTSTSPILCISELLNIGVTIHAVICMHNVSNVLAYFLWGSSVGKQNKCMNIHFNPKAGVIKPKDIFKVTVSLKPNETGILEQIFIPCFIGRVEEPVMLTVMCAVDNIHVYFDLPTPDGRRKRILWPPQIIDEYNYHYYDLPLGSHEEDIVSTNKLSAVPYLDTKSCYQNILIAKSNFEKNIGNISPQQSIDFISNFKKRYTNCYEQTPQTLSAESIAIKPSLIQRFGSDLILEDNYIEITDVPIKTRKTLQQSAAITHSKLTILAVKKTILMHNLTPMTSSYRAEVTNFEPLYVKPTSLEELLEKAGLQKAGTFDYLFHYTL